MKDRRKPSLPAEAAAKSVMRLPDIKVVRSDRTQQRLLQQNLPVADTIAISRIVGRADSLPAAWRTYRAGCTWLC